jgi:phosphoglycerate dehydrogenase-like enzyme
MGRCRKEGQHQAGGVEETYKEGNGMYKVAYFTVQPICIDLVVGLAPPEFNVVASRATVSEAEKIEILRDADFLILHGGGRVTDACLRAATKLKHFQLFAAGYYKENLVLLSELGIPISNVPGEILQSVAEVAIAMILALNRRLIQMDQGTRKGKWRWDLSTGLDHFELAEKTVGIIGFGRLGKVMARRLRGFDTPILYCDVVADPVAERELNAKRVPLDELLKESDIVSIHAPLTPETRGLIGERELSLMKPSALLINVGRGPIVDEAALIAALKANKIRGAGLDVFAKEPTDPDNPLFKMDNVVLSPHLAGTTYESVVRRANFAYQNFQRVLAGQEPLQRIRQR